MAPYPGFYVPRSPYQSLQDYYPSSTYQAVDPFRIGVTPPTPHLPPPPRPPHPPPAPAPVPVPAPAPAPAPEPLSDTNQLLPLWQGPPKAGSGLSALQYAKAIVVDSFLAQLYLLGLLRLPALYFTRVSRIFVDHELILPELAELVASVAARESPGQEQAALRTGQSLNAANANANANPMSAETWTISGLSEDELPRSYTRLMKTWEDFIDSLLKEWKILNLVSVLLLGCVYSRFLALFFFFWVFFLV